MSGMARDDIRRLLKEFGIGADGAVISHLARNREIKAWLETVKSKNSRSG
jgi:hypothetical protein